MRLAAAALVLGLACAPLQAQLVEPKEPKRAPEKKAPKVLQDRQSRQPSSAPDSKKRSESRSESDHKRREQRSREPVKPPATTSAPAAKAAPDRQRRPPVNEQRPPNFQRPPATTQSSPGQQQLRRLDEDRKAQRQQQDADWRRTMDEKRAVRCTAYPVCSRQSGGYGGCRGVEQTYSGVAAASGRQDIVRQCVQANTPDSCNCSPQCSRVAHCS